MQYVELTIVTLYYTAPFIPSLVVQIRILAGVCNIPHFSKYDTHCLRPQFVIHTAFFLGMTPGLDG